MSCGGLRASCGPEKGCGSCGGLQAASCGPEMRYGLGCGGQWFFCGPETGCCLGCGELQVSCGLETGWGLCCGCGCAVGHEKASADRNCLPGVAASSGTAEASGRKATEIGDGAVVSAPGVAGSVSAHWCAWAAARRLA